MRQREKARSTSYPGVRMHVLPGAHTYVLPQVECALGTHVLPRVRMYYPGYVCTTLGMYLLPWVRTYVLPWYIVYPREQANRPVVILLHPLHVKHLLSCQMSGKGRKTLPAT